ncbi:MAG: energy transducer TonB, partial [Pyrinomonadaceae bacterium]
LFLFFLVTISNFVSAQTEKYTAPVKWERYAVKDKQVSVLFPKLPVLEKKSDACNDKDTDTYSAYANEVVYTLRIVSGTKAKNRKFCLNKKDFDENSFQERLNELKNSTEKVEELNYKFNEREVVKIINNTYTYWLFNDYKNKRWFELWTRHRDDIKPQTKDFIESIKFEKDQSAIEIGEGAIQTFGDFKEESVNVESSAQTNNNKENVIQKSEKSEISAGLVIAQRPQPRYTDAARENKTQGTVTLKVTFLSSGGIGNIETVSGLPFGLTEQAVIAAQKIVFIPAKRNGITYSVVKTVVYTFSIY